MISAYIFNGPTLPAFQVRDRLGYRLTADQELVLPSGQRIKFLPPVSEGDVLRLVPLRPKMIGVIDGYFETVPAVWHREILYAMSQGIHVIGASSMGALRAAELEAFGMEGVGAVFQAFSDGLLEDDDEVAVIHGAAEMGFPLLSEAMVNIRRTLEDACGEGFLGQSERDALIRIAKQLHYKSRSYAKILSMAQEQDLDGRGMSRFKGWLPEGRKDQKLLDALALVDVIISRLGGNIEPKQVLYSFENTIPWQRSRTEDSEF